MTREDARAVLEQSRENMRMSAARARRRFPKAAEAVTTPALPAPETKTKAEPQRQPEVSVDLTEIPAFTVEMLSAHTGASLRSIRGAIRTKRIRVTRQKKGSRLLNAADTVRWLWTRHSIAPMALLDIYLQES
jgi:hypothetical protein